jgi:hypothetical protein
LRELEARQHIRIEGEGRSRRSYYLPSAVHKEKPIRGEVDGEVVEYAADGDAINRRIVKIR